MAPYFCSSVQLVCLAHGKHIGVEFGLWSIDSGLHAFRGRNLENVRNASRSYICTTGRSAVIAIQLVSR
jgi:hypothetical protein